MAQGHTFLGAFIHFLGLVQGVLFSVCRKREMLHLVNKVEIYFSKIGFVDCK